MENLSSKIAVKKARPIKIVQFGEGNFLRAFCDYFIQRLNDSGAINSDVLVVQPMAVGRIDALKEQDGLYTLYLQGVVDGEPRREKMVIDVLGDFVNPYTDYQRYLNCAHNPDLEIVISNTTEAGIALDKNDTDFSKCPSSFPAKVLAFLHERYKHFGGDMTKGLAFAPCELIDYNGAELKRVLLELAAIKGMEKGFISFIEDACEFSSTLVDRIVPGYPADRIDEVRKECGYIDNSVVVGEHFHLWVLEKGKRLERFLNAKGSGLNIIFADDITPYKQRKVKILNGAHTALTPIAYLSGMDTVGEAVTDPVIADYINKLIFEEINPTINLPADELKDFSDSVLARFLNPFVRHELMSISLNSTTKFATRLLPSIRDYIRIKNQVPRRLTFALAALIEFFKGDRNGQKIALSDSPEYLDRWRETFAGNKSCAEVAAAVCGFTDIYGENLADLHKDFLPVLTEYLCSIKGNGMYKAVENI